MIVRSARAARLASGDGVAFPAHLVDDLGRDNACRRPRRRGLHVQLFAGGGGASQGELDATGASPDVAVNHWPVAIAIHRANHAETTHHIADVFEVDPTVATGGLPVDFLWMSPTCFPAGTLVLTTRGMRPIEEVAVGDEVLTHRARWRRVVATTSKESTTVVVRGQGHYGIETTPDHPFYSKRITRRWPRSKDAQGKRSGRIREIVENPYWPTADSMVGKLWATPIRFADASIPICPTASFSEDFFYFVGRWLGDGFTSKGDVQICTGADDFDAMRTIFQTRPLTNERGDPTVPRVREANSPAPRLAWGNAALARWLDEHFGSDCESKQLPAWVLSMQESWRRALLHGYVDADGFTAGNLVSTSTVSKALAVGIRLLAASLGHTPCLYHVVGRPGKIDGRRFVGRDSYKVNWHTVLQKQTAFRDGSHLFTWVKEVIETDRVKRVYCLQVDEDESYVADGIVVHNCTHFSAAKGRALRDERLRAQAWVIRPWIVETRPAVIILENVKEFLTWGPLIEEHAAGCPGGSDGEGCLGHCRYGHPDKARAGETFREWRDWILAQGYSFEFRVLVAWEYGAPTTRERLYIVMRADGRAAHWPRPTHAPTPTPERPHRWRTAAEVIDWSIPCRSIFGRKKPLAEASLRRIVRGVGKFVLGPFAQPFLVRGSGSGADVTDAAFLAKHYGERREAEVMGQALDRPIGTVTAQDHHALVAASLVKFYGTSTGAPVDRPLGVVTAQGWKHGLSLAFLSRYNGCSVGQSMASPIGTLETRDRYSLISADLAPREAPDLGRAREVYRLMVRHGYDGPGLDHEQQIVLVVVGDVPYVVVDLAMRMLVARELFRAQGFPDTYVIAPIGPRGVALSGRDQIRACGNSVCPPVAAALIRAVLELDEDPEAGLEEDLPMAA